MHFDDRTFLFSASITMAILAIVLLSMRRSIYQTTHGLGMFAMANLMGTMGAMLIGLRGAIPFPVSYFGGNFGIMMTGLLYIGAIRAFDEKPTHRLLVPLGALASLIALYLVDSTGEQAARVALTNGFLGFCGFYSSYILWFAGQRTFNRIFCALGFFGSGAASLTRAITVYVSDSDLLFSQTAGSSSLYLAIAILTSIFTLGFIMLVNERTHDRLLYLATHDALTGARTRGSFMEMARQAMERSATDKKPLAVFIADLDHFKRINDSFGHQAGDKALRNFVKAANEALRKNDVLARYGGEEFVVLLPDTNMKDALGVAERLRSITQATVAPSELGQNPVTVSIGVATAGSQGLDVEALIASADHALYASKAQGRNRVTAATSPDVPDAETQARPG